MLATPSDPKESDELVEDHGAARVGLRQGQVVPRPDEAGHLQEHRRRDAVMATSGDEKTLRAAWEGWHTISPPMRKDYHALRRAVEQGRARSSGFADTGAMWRSEVRHAARRVHEGARSAVGSGAAALPEAARLRAHEAAREVRRRRAGERPDPGAPARQHLGAGLVERLPAGRAAERRSRATRSPTS